MRIPGPDAKCAQISTSRSTFGETHLFFRDGTFDWYDPLGHEALDRLAQECEGFRIRDHVHISISLRVEGAHT